MVRGIVTYTIKVTIITKNRSPKPKNIIVNIIFDQFD